MHRAYKNYNKIMNMFDHSLFFFLRITEIKCSKLKLETIFFTLIRNRFLFVQVRTHIDGEMRIDNRLLCKVLRSRILYHSRWRKQCAICKQQNGYDEKESDNYCKAVRIAFVTMQQNNQFFTLLSLLDND